ncbi:HCL538Wp [Eremothecium sinecaudum]|uniref:HCL538Wp n=1 Tax=Eremothecium sinecaudum TaxID=45286 RepID=A0A109UY54_9SACH|nr:HCL538Wp [Eremothecium sinecaudum]AMD19613.1 HCL538Wp [Eremothecium sinecaudum]
MGKVSKATKKFQTKHLKHTLDHRKKIKAHNKKIQGRRGNKSEEEKKALALTKDEQKLQKSTKEEVFKDMSVEKFFDGGFAIPKVDKKLGAAKPNGSEDESDQESDSSFDEDDMKENMENLASKDPEFYEYLKKNDEELLDFQATNPLDGISDEEEEPAEELEKEKKPEESGQVSVSLKMVSKWRKALKEKPTTKLVRNLVSAFKAAVNVNKDESANYLFAVSDAKAFQELMFLVLKDLPVAIQKMVPYKIVRNVRTLPSNLNVTKLSSILKVHAGSLIVLLQDITNTETAALVLHSTNELLPYFLSYRKILKELISSAVYVWSTTQEVDTQIAIFAFLNNASREFKKSLLQTVLKSTYSTFMKSCRKTNMRTMPLINLQKNSSTELFGIDPVLGYQIGFEYIRQLAINLRNTTSGTTKRSSKVNSAEAYKLIYNWQYCHALDFWSRVLAAHCNPEKEKGTESPLRQLIYPLVQVTLGVIRLVPTAQFFPLRFYLIRSLIRLSQHTGVFIPIYPLLSEILSSTAFTKQAKKNSSLAMFDFDHNIKCNQAYLGTKIYQDALAEQFVELVAEFYVLYAKSVAFPELTTPAIISLRRYVKTTKNMKFNRMLSVLIEKLNKNNDFILKKRSQIDFGPNNKSEVARFLNDVPWETTPLGSYVKAQREVKEEKARILRESLEEEKNSSQDEELLPDASSDAADDEELSE